MEIVGIGKINVNKLLLPFSDIARTRGRKLDVSVCYVLDRSVCFVACLYR
jgi:hypothetical protein